VDFLKKVLNVFFNKYIGLAIEFFSSVLLVGYLGANDYGQYTAIYVLPILLSSLGGFGFGPSIVYFINREGPSIRKYLWTFTSLGMIFGLIYITIIMFFYVEVNEIFYKGRVSNTLFLISLLFIPIIIIQKYLRSIIRGLYKIKIYSILLDIVAPFSRLALIFGLIYIDYELAGAVIIPILVQSLITICMFVYLFYKSLNEVSSYFIGVADLVTMTKFGLKTFLGSAILKSNNSIIMLIATALLSFRDLGILSLAMKLLQLISGFSGAILTVLMPKVSRSTFEEIKKFIPRISRTLFTMSFVGLFLYLLFVEYIVVYLYGMEFIDIVSLSIPLGIATILLPLSNTLMVAVTFTGDPIKKTYARGAGMLINLITCYPLFLAYNSLGLAISIAFSQLLTFYLAWFFYDRRFKDPLETNMFFIRITDVLYYLELIKNLKKRKV